MKTLTMTLKNNGVLVDFWDSQSFNKSSTPVAEMKMWAADFKPLGYVIKVVDDRGNATNKGKLPKREMRAR